jgi:hypothetical protein
LPSLKAANTESMSALLDASCDISRYKPRKAAAKLPVLKEVPWTIIPATCARIALAAAIQSVRGYNRIQPLSIYAGG